MNILAVIPARGGSKGVPRKNVRPLAGKPLIGWTVDAALSSQAFQRVVVSTDDEEIAAVAERHGASAPFRRPAALSDDTAPAAPVISHALHSCEAIYGQYFDAVAYLQPTSPFRTAQHILDAVDRFASVRCDTLVSVVRVPHNMTADAQFSVNEGMVSGSGPKRLRRQDKPVTFARNGPAILILSRDQALAGQLYGSRTLAFEMDRLSSVDIDDEEDLRWAEALAHLVRRSADGR